MAGYNVALTPREKISKAKIRLYRENPFFSYLVEHLRIVEVKDDDPRFKGSAKTMAVDNHGTFYYFPEFVEKLSDDEMMGVVSHEVLHLSFRHPHRTNGRNIVLQTPDGGQLSLWNVAIDVVVNNVVLHNGLKLPEGCILPQNDSIEMFGTKIDNISKKSAEEIYEELKVNLRDQMGKGKGKGQGQGDGKTIYVDDPDGNPNIDGHMFDEKGEGKGQPEEGQEKDWGKTLAEAYNYAKQRGITPAGMGREYDVLGKSMVNWRSILRREIGKRIPIDYTWSKPSRRFLSQDIYMPATTGEEVKVLIGIDTSGSISRKELSEFMTEVMGISKAFSNVEFRILTHDSEVHDDILISDGNRNKLLNLSLKGGGGTDHKPLYEHIKQKKYNRRYTILVSFTDGYSDYPVKPNVDTVFVLSGEHCGKAHMPRWGTCLELRRNA